MNLGSCHAPAWAPSKPPPNSARAATMRIRGQLCRLCDLALETKDNGRQPRTRHEELKIFRALHGDFERLDLHTVHGISAAECDVCRLARAAKRLALSAYAGEWTDFIRTTRGTRDGMAARVNRDPGDDFRRYIVRAGLPEHSTAYQLMARAVVVSHHLAALAPDAEGLAEDAAPACVRVVGTPPGSFDGGRIESAQAEADPSHAHNDRALIVADMEEICRRIDIMSSNHLRIVR